MQITDIFRAKIVDVQPSLTIEITGNESKVEKFLDLMDHFGMMELTRTAAVALPRKYHWTARIFNQHPLKRKTICLQKFTRTKTLTSAHSQRQNARGARLRLPGPRPRSESQGQRLNVIIGLYEGSSRSPSRAKGVQGRLHRGSRPAADVIFVALPDTKQASRLQAGHRAIFAQGQDAAVLARVLDHFKTVVPPKTWM